MSKLTGIIPLKNNLQQSVKFQQISDELYLSIKDIPEIEKLKCDAQLLEFLCTGIEHLCKKKYKLDKLALLKYTLKRVCELTPEDENLITSIVEYLLANKLIKKVTMLTQSTSFLKSFVISKFSP